MKARYRKYFIRNIMSVRDDFATYYVQDTFARRDTIFGVELMRYFSHRDTVEWLIDCLAFDHCARYELRSFLSENGTRRYLLHWMDDRQVIDEVARVLMDGDFPVVVRPEYEPPWRQSELIDLLHEIRDGRSETEPVPGSTGKRFQFNNLVVNRWPEVALDGSVVSNIKNMPAAVFNTLVNELVVDVSNAFLWDAQYVQDHGFKKWLSDGLKKQWDLVKKDTKKLEELARTGPNELLWYLTSDELWDDVGNQLKSVFYAESWKNAFAILIPVALLRKIGGGKRAGSGSAARRGANATRQGTKRRTRARSAADPKHRQKSAAKTGPKTTLPTGVGATGEGIPIERVKPDVLKEVHPDSKAAYGYSPNKGTAYEEFDFTDVDAAKKNRKIRTGYIEGSKRLEGDIKTMRAEGASREQIGNHVVNERNLQKVEARKYMSSEEIEVLEKRNLKKYKNPVGPTPEQAFMSQKKKLIRSGEYSSDSQVWDRVIEKSMEKDDVINTLLGIEHH